MPGKDQYLDEGQLAVTETPSTRDKNAREFVHPQRKKARFAVFPTIGQTAVSGWTQRNSYTWWKSDSFLDNVVINTALIPRAGIFIKHVILASTYPGSGRSCVDFSESRD